MPRFVTIRYGDGAGYDRTDAAVRDAAHAHDARLQETGVAMGIADPRETRPLCRPGPARTVLCTCGWRSVMRTMSYSESRAKYAETLSAVVNDREEVVITRAGHDPVVMVSLDDYESLKEAAYLLRSPENARRLLASIDRLEAGRGVERGLVE
ncbi:type II toxin-antitoxin system Phd/YefM family antitoxin [Modestobacter lapidis]